MFASEVHGLATGSRVGPWRILGHRGSGTFGIVYRVCLAEEPGAGEYALKLAREPGDLRFEREGELLSRIRHPHVPGLRDRGVWHDSQRRGYPYLVMQWVEGLPLYDWAKVRGLTSRQTLRVLAHLARALQATHRHGVHRDVKGDNVLVTSEDHAVLVDFGCCRYPGARELTTGVLPPGTRPYRSPQALRHEREGNPADRYVGTPEDDVYALGVTAYYLVTGTYPPQGSEDAPRLLAPGELASVAPELEALILRMLSENTQARGTAGQLAEALEQAEKSAGRVANEQVRPSRSMLTTETATRPGPTRWHLASQALRKHSKRLTVAGALAAGVLAGGLLHPLSRPASEARPEQLAAVNAEEQEQAAVSKKPVALADGGVDEVLAAAEQAPVYGVPNSVLGQSVLKKPVPGQRKAPCENPRQRVILGFCWWRLDEKPPCAKGEYEHEERCYGPVVENGRQPTSEEP
ncbi:MAG TPA: serine/threonine-protein kinase [Myxococcaceae bacterium]|nr:serine/threonine-protein kinase [Myxococcaceae bacterium]